MRDVWDDDRDPLAALRRGDPRLFEEFVRVEAPTFIHFFERIGADSGQAEDLTQEVFLRLYRSADDYERRDKFAAYALRVARNAWIDSGRRSAARPAGNLRGATNDAELDVERADANSAPIDHGLETGEESRRAIEALKLLPDGQRMVFELAVLQERPYPEIAELLGIPIGTVKSRVFNAVRRLREMLEGDTP